MVQSSKKGKKNCYNELKNGLEKITRMQPAKHAIIKQPKPRLGIEGAGRGRG